VALRSACGTDAASGATSTVLDEAVGAAAFVRTAIKEVAGPGVPATKWSVICQNLSIRHHFAQLHAMEPPPGGGPYARGRRLVTSLGEDLGSSKIFSIILNSAENLYQVNLMLAGAIDEADSSGVGEKLREAIVAEVQGLAADDVLPEKRKIFASEDPVQIGHFNQLVKRLEAPPPSISPTVSVNPRHKRTSKKDLKDEDVGIVAKPELPVEPISYEEKKLEYESFAPEEFASMYAEDDVEDQEELNRERAKEASLRARQFNGRYVNTPRGKTGATLSHPPAWRTAYDAPRERARKLAQLAAEESAARVTSATNNLRSNIEAHQLQQLQESRHAQAQAIASKARSAEHDRREAERRRERRELISNAYEVMYGETLGDAINELGVEEEMRMAKEFYKIMGGKGSPGFLRKAYSPRAARVTTVAMERKVSPPKRTTRKKKSVKFVLEEVDVPQKKISKRTYMKKSSGKSGKRGSGGKKGKGKGKKGKGKGKGGKK